MYGIGVAAYKDFARKNLRVNPEAGVYKLGQVIPLYGKLGYDTEFLKRFVEDSGELKETYLTILANILQSLLPEIELKDVKRPNLHMLDLLLLGFLTLLEVERGYEMLAN